MSLKKALCIAFALVIVLTAVTVLVPSLGLWHAIFPGVLVFFLIAGPHGGTTAEALTGVVLGTVVNVALYSLLILGVSKIMGSGLSK